MTTKTKERRVSAKPILRPRTAYNFFYRHQRGLILNERSTTSEKSYDEAVGENLIKKRTNGKSHGLISLQQLTKIVAKRWKEASPEIREKYKNIAEKDKVRYSHAMMFGVNSRQKNIPQDFESSQDAGLGFGLSRPKIVNTSFLDSKTFGVSAIEAINSFDDGKDFSLNFQLRSNFSMQSNPSDFIDPLGLTWSAGELDILKQL